MKLLGRANTKTLKGEKVGFLTFIMHLAPSWLSGYQVCPMASKGCIYACLNLSGMGKFSNVQAARIAKTKYFFEQRESFMAKLVKEIKAGIKKAEKKGMVPAFRLNGTSDLRWEEIPVGDFANVMLMFPSVQFYDYTKIPNRRNVPANYHLTFSRSESNETVLSSIDFNIAVVFDKLPDTYLGRPVVDGTDTDLRFLDPAGVVVGLVANGKAVKDTSGFVVRIAA